jgi:tetratricopeptide (TPR) repeat protein
MLSRLSLIFLLVLADLPVEAVTLRGVILANELSGPPMENVEVDATSGTNHTVSDSSGKFTLDFPQRRVGETVRITVKKDGYEVVNDVQLETTLSADPDAKPLIILLCKEADREEMARRFYRLKSFDAIEETYRKRAKELEDAQQATVAAIAKLQQERDQAKAAAEKASEELAKNQPGQSSELYQKAKQLLAGGKIEEAIQSLDDEKLHQSLAQAKKAIDDVVQAWLLKAQLLTVQFRFEDAEKAYQGAIDAAPDNFAANFAFAYFSQGLNRYKQAVTAYNRCLELANKNQSKSELALTLNNLGNLDRTQGRMEEARNEFAEALQIRRELAQKNPETHQPYLANSLNNLGILDHDQGRMEEARKEYTEALQTYRELAQKNPETYQPYVAGTLNNLGILDRGQGRREEARKEHAEALQTYRELAQKNKNQSKSELALTLNNLGNLDRTQGRMEEARNEFAEALQTYRELAQKNPETYQPYVAIALNNLGVLDHDQGRMEEARKEFKEALQTCRELAQRNPDVYLPDVATTLNSLGMLDRHQNRMEEARKEFAEALQIYESFAKKNPERFSADVTRVQKLLADLPK